MAITIEGYSTELEASNHPNYAPLNPNQEGGRVRGSVFTLSTGSGGLTDGDNYAVVRIPSGARILGGSVAFEAMGASATLNIGLMGRDLDGFYDKAGSNADNEEFFVTEIDVSAIGTGTFATTLAKNYLFETDKECFLVVTIAGTNWAANKTLKGHIEYMVD